MRARAARPVLSVVSGTQDAGVLLAALPVPVVMLDRANRFRYANPAAEQFLGLSMSQLARMALAALIPGDSPIFALIDQCRLRGLTMTEHGVILESPRLPRRCCTLHAAPVADEPGAVLISAHDETAARVLDGQLSFRSAARSVAGMAAILAHEVKNPLSGIRGAAQLLENSVGPDDRELAVLVRDEADRIRAIVDRMEMFADRPTPLRAVNIHRVLEHVRRLAQSGFAAHLRIVESYDPSLPSVLGDRDLLVQVLLNLVKNAAESITFGGSGGEIVLATRYRQGLRVRVPGTPRRVHLPLEVSVRDDGPGVPEDIRPNLFDAFVSSKQGGSGLGLALVAKIVGDHGGLIEVESAPGRTEFRLHLPVLPDDEADGQIEPEAGLP